MINRSLGCSSSYFCDFLTVLSWKSVMMIVFLKVVVMLAGQFARKILYSRFDELEVRPFVDLLHHAEITFISQAQLVLYAVSTNDIVWRIIALTALLYYQTECPCNPAESNPVVAIVKAGTRHVSWTCNDDDGYDEEERKRQRIVTQRLISWAFLFLFLSWLYAATFHGFFIQFLQEEIEPEVLEMRLCCRLSCERYWVLSIMEFVGIYVSMRLNCQTCACSSFLGESIVRTTFMILADSLGVAGCFIFLNPLTALLPLVVCDYSNVFALRLLVTLLATIASTRVITLSVCQKVNSDKSAINATTNNTNTNRISHHGRLCSMLSLPVGETFDDQLIEKSIVESYSFAAAFRLRKWLNRKLNSFSTRISNLNKNACGISEASHRYDYGSCGNDEDARSREEHKSHVSKESCSASSVQAGSHVGSADISSVPSITSSSSFCSFSIHGCNSQPARGRLGGFKRRGSNRKRTFVRGHLSSAEHQNRANVAVEKA